MLKLELSDGFGMAKVSRPIQTLCLSVLVILHLTTALSFVSLGYRIQEGRCSQARRNETRIESEQASWISRLYRVSDREKLIIRIRLHRSFFYRMFASFEASYFSHRNRVR
jgi:hypothetical protein